MTAKLLILDLDETLLYATQAHLGREPDFFFFGYHCYLRPHVREFIAYCLAHFGVAGENLIRLCPARHRRGNQAISVSD